MPTDALRDLLMDKPEHLGETFESARFLDRVEVGALQVFDEPEDELHIVAGIAANNSGHGLEACEARRAPPPFARDELVTVPDSTYK